MSVPGARVGDRNRLPSKRVCPGMNNRLPGQLSAAILVLAMLLTACGGEPVSTITAPGTPIASDALPIGDPPPAGGELTLPKPGQLDPRDVRAELLEAAVVGRAVTLRISYTSGVEPCYVLDSVLVTPGDHTFAITIREGHGPGDMACVEIAVQKHTIVELGELDPGSYTITDTTGGAAPIEVVVS
jgi:hypothetical protein